MKKVLIIAGSPRKDGNSDLLARQFAKGAAESGNAVETVYLREKKINYCQGCLVCLKKGECFQKDDANSLLPKMMEADVVCFSCPVYYYSVCGQMKVFLDRMNPLYGKLKDKDFYYMVTAQDDNKAQLDLFSAMGHPFQQFAEMMSRSSVTSGCSLVWRRTDFRLPS